MGAGLLKIMSKMGISTISSYRNSRLFDVIGLNEEIVSECFDGTTGFLKGLSYDDIDARLNSNHQRAFTNAFEGKKNYSIKVDSINIKKVKSSMTSHVLLSQPFKNLRRPEAKRTMLR